MAPWKLEIPNLETIIFRFHVKLGECTRHDWSINPPLGHVPTYLITSTPEIAGLMILCKPVVPLIWPAFLNPYSEGGTLGGLVE